MKYKVGICSVGSGVGQAVIDSCHLAALDFATVGLGNNPLAYGLYDCDEYALIPSYYDEFFIAKLLQVCLNKQIDLIIPGHDDEACRLAESKEIFEAKGIQVLCSLQPLANLCRDKGKLGDAFNGPQEFFAKSMSGAEFKNNWEKADFQFPVIAKPIDGFASRGITIIRSCADFHKITEKHLIQELLYPSSNDPNRSLFDRMIEQGENAQLSEVSIQIVFDSEGSVMGKMASSIKLKNGVPIEILPYDGPEFWDEIQGLIAKLSDHGARGPVNLQGRMTDHGLRLFEINPRFTGISGVRARLGFNEVEACLTHWLLKKSITLETKSTRIGIQQVKSRVVNPEIVRQSEAPPSQLHLRKNKPTLLVTGSTGEIGKRLVQEVLKRGTYRIMTLDRDKAIAAGRCQHSAETDHYDWNDLQSGTLDLSTVDRILHLASARPKHGNEEIALSLKRSQALFARAVQFNVEEIINISSQSVYTKRNRGLSLETDEPNPNSTYSMSKYALETYLQNLGALTPALKHTSIRLATVSGVHSDAYANELLSKMVQSCIDKHQIRVMGAELTQSRLDILDAVEGLVLLSHSNSDTWKTTYNLGNPEQSSLGEIAKMIEYESKERWPDTFIDVRHLPRISEQHFGMNSERFQKDFGWEAKRSHYMIIKTLFHSYLQ